jgi:hypothetical protein
MEYEPILAFFQGFELCFEVDPDPHPGEKSGDPDPHQGYKSNPDADPQNWTEFNIPGGSSP